MNSTEKHSDKIAVLFPGIGYTCDKPLLYYSGKLAARNGYEIVPVPYGNFPSGVKGNREKMEQAFYSAMEQAEEILQNIDWKQYSEILFFSKSVGTIVSSAYARKHQLSVKNILLTPVKDTFSFADGNSIAFHGTSDPWAETEDIAESCKKLNIPLYITDHANHSLETGDVMTDIRNLSHVMEAITKFISK